VLVSRVTCQSTNKLVLVFGVRPESYNKIGTGIQIVQGRGLEGPDDLVVDTVLAASDGIRVGDTFRS
jgi:hypothetical protein